MQLRGDKRELKKRLIRALLELNAFWSYADVTEANVPDEEWIEKAFIYLDLKEIATLFEIYPKSYLRRVWEEKMVIQGDYLFDLNVMIAICYFGIKQPEKYLKQLEREHVKTITDYA